MIQILLKLAQSDAGPQPINEDLIETSRQYWGKAKHNGLGIKLLMCEGDREESRTCIFRYLHSVQRHVEERSEQTETVLPYSLSMLILVRSSPVPIIGKPTAKAPAMEKL